MASRKLAAAGSQELQDLEMDMSPMIDMVFLLLIFFMVNATMIVNSMDPAVNIPVGDKAQTPESAAGRVVINVYQDGVFANGNGRDKKSAILADESAITSYVHDMDRLNKLDGIKTRILIRADQGASVGQVKKAVQAAGDAGVIDIIFAAYQKAQGGK